MFQGSNFDQDCSAVIASWNRRTIICRLTYFKKRGKYYADGDFQVSSQLQLFEIWEKVAQMRKAGKLPGLVEGAGEEFSILVDVPGHPHAHPHLIP